MSPPSPGVRNSRPPEVAGPQISEAHWNVLIPKLLDGRVVLFTGAGVHMFIRGRDEPWGLGRFLPSGAELAAHLAQFTSYQGRDKDDLLRVSQYLALVEGSAPLYERLHEVLDADYPATPLHALIADLPSRMRARPTRRSFPLVVTTNYDDVLERSLSAAGEPFDVIWYVADGDQRGKFWHRTPDGKCLLIEKPNEYTAVSTDERLVVLKIHGNVDRAQPEQDSFVITEDHYIEYLTNTDVASLLPVMIAKTLNTSHFLFLGYGLRDWNLRVILHRMWTKRRLGYTSWAVQKEPTELDTRFWRLRQVEVLDCDLGAYVDLLTQRCSNG
jgi:hypothetical protein